MHYTAQHAIKVRLTMWKSFFDTGHDATPEGATDAEYGLDVLIDLARDGDSTELHELADLVELMGINYNLRNGHELYRALMCDEPASDQLDTRKGVTASCQ